MRRLVMTGFVALALFATACGGSGDSETGRRGVPTGTDQTAEAAQKVALIAELGSEDAAADALIIAMDRGYSGPQILDAVDRDLLRSNGAIEGQEPAGQALGLVLYELEGEGEGAVGTYGGTSPGDVMLASFLQAEVTQTPLELLRKNATKALGVGEPGIDLILRLLKARFTPEQVIEALILGIDGSADHPWEPDGPISCIRVVDEIYCPGGENFPLPSESDSEPDEAAAAPTPEPDPVDTGPMQLLWEGELTPDPQFVKNPVAGSFRLTRTAGTNDFQITLMTADAKSGTFTTDGFDSVECDTEWSSTFEGTGTFWDINDLGIEFAGQITRSIVYTAGPCDAVLDPETSDFSGVVVRITETGIEAGFNAWTFEVAGPPPVPVTE